MSPTPDRVVGSEQGQPRPESLGFLPMSLYFLQHPLAAWTQLDWAHSWAGDTGSMAVWSRVLPVSGKGAGARGQGTEVSMRMRPGI